MSLNCFRGRCVCGCGRYAAVLLSQVIRRRELSLVSLLSLRVLIFALSPHSGRIIAATNHPVGFTGQEIDVLSFQNNGEPYEGPDDVITPAADRFGGRRDSSINPSMHWGCHRNAEQTFSIKRHSQSVISHTHTHTQHAAVTWWCKNAAGL